MVHGKAFFKLRRDGQPFRNSLLLSTLVVSHPCMYYQCVLRENLSNLQRKKKSVANLQEVVWPGLHLSETIVVTILFYSQFDQIRSVWPQVFQFADKPSDLRTYFSVCRMTSVSVVWFWLNYFQRSVPDATKLHMGE